MSSIGSRLLFCIGSFALTASAVSSSAQSVPELPQASPKARVEQRVGLTDFSVDYSSPAVKGRKIWGELVPYDKPWRAGANAATRLTASGAFKLAGKPVPAGSYALYAIPGKASWTIALSSSVEAWGNDGYDPAKDVLRVTIKPQAAPSRERMTFVFSDTTDTAARLDLEWEKLRVSIPLEVDTKTQALANIQKATDDSWRAHYSSARYLLDSSGDLAKALTFIDQSIAIKPNWSNHWVRAQILGKQGRAADAIATAEKTVQLGTGDRVFESFYKADVTKSLASWKQQKR
jgi:tetratricopeptide (TPR) repeat protein